MKFQKTKIPNSKNSLHVEFAIGIWNLKNWNFNLNQVSYEIVFSQKYSFCL